MDFEKFRKESKRRNGQQTTGFDRECRYTTREIHTCACNLRLNCTDMVLSMQPSSKPPTPTLTGAKKKRGGGGFRGKYGSCGIFMEEESIVYLVSRGNQTSRNASRPCLASRPHPRTPPPGPGPSASTTQEHELRIARVRTHRII